MIEINKIYNEDCLLTMGKMPNDFVDLTVTSPPYDNLRNYHGYSFDFKSISKELYRVTKNGGVVVWVVGDATIKGSETGTSFRQALHFKEIGFNLHDTMIYLKNNFANPASNRYHQVFEYIFILVKNKLKTFNPIKDRKNIYIGQKAHGKNRTKDGWRDNTSGETKNEFGMRHNVWKYTTGGGHVSKDKIAYKHPAIFPEELVKDHIVSWSNQNDLIYDPFLGSGTTAKMSVLLKRNWIGSEISKEYCDIVKERLSKLSLSPFQVDDQIGTTT